MDAGKAEKSNWSYSGGGGVTGAALEVSRCPLRVWTIVAIKLHMLNHLKTVRQLRQTESKHLLEKFSLKILRSSQ